MVLEGIARQKYYKNGEPVESDYTFTAKKSEMEVEVSYTFNASALGGKDLVTFEELYFKWTVTTDL